MERNSKRRRISQHSSPSSILGSGCKGVILTCDRGKENQACLEIYRLLDEFIEKHYGSSIDPKETEDPDKESKEDLSNQLDHELNQLKQSNIQKNYSRIELGMKAVVFIRILRPEVDPVVIIQDLFHTSKKEHKSFVRYCARVIPVQSTCYAHVEDVIKNLKPLLSTIFTESNKGIKWYARITVRNNNVFSKQECIQELISILEPDYPSDYKDPSIAINIEINKGTASLSVIPQWSTMNDLSLRTLLLPKQSHEKINSSTSKKDLSHEDWKCSHCDAPNFKTFSTCWKCKELRTPVLVTNPIESSINEKEDSKVSSDSETEFKLFG